MKKKALLPLVVAILSALVAFLGAMGLQGRVRTVDILNVFFGGFGAGAGLVAAIAMLRQRSLVVRGR